MLPPKLLIQVMNSAAKLKKCSESNKCNRDAALAQKLTRYTDRLRKIKVTQKEIASMLSRNEITLAQKDALMSKYNAERADMIKGVTSINKDTEFIKCQRANCEKDLLAQMGVLIKTLRAAIKDRKKAGANTVHAESELAMLVALNKERNLTMDAVHEMMLMVVSLNLRLM